MQAQLNRVLGGAQPCVPSTILALKVKGQGQICSLYSTYRNNYDTILCKTASESDQ